MSKLIESIRAEYATPVAHTSQADIYHEYCVGGAICMYLTGPDATHFPNAGHLAWILQTQNERLTASRAMEYAEEIIDANDCARFAQAWASAAQALAYGQ